MLALFAVLVTLQATQGIRPPDVRQVPARPRGWVAFVADLKIAHPERSDQYGRYLQDEHGCFRRETVHPDGSLMVAINNFETERFYQLIRGLWTVRAMRIGPMPRQPPRRPGIRKAEPVEGFDAWITSISVRDPRGNYTRESTIIPALNDFEAVQTMRNGETITAFNIRLTRPDHSEFLPPPGAGMVERPEPGGFLALGAVVVKVQFEGSDAVELTTTEETPFDFRTPLNEKFALVTAIVDHAKNVVRVRVLRNAVRRGPGRVDGELVDEVVTGLGQTAKTTKLVENFSVTITRIRERTAR